jgi:Bacterial Ig-like domain (group 1)/PQQ enzyme repeat
MIYHRFATALGAVVLGALVTLSSPALLPGASAQVSVLTNKYDNARDGLNSSESLLSLGNVTSSQFGKLNTFNVDGYIQAQPLYMYGLSINGGTHNVVFVATMNNSVYAIDADTSAQLWQVNLGTPVPSATEGCSGVTGFNQIGILSTPVIDPATNTMYLTAKTYGTGSGPAAYSLHALDVTTGLEKFGGPVSITATIGTLTFTPLNYIQRPGLLLSNGNVYLGFGSNGCDLNARGWIFAFSASNLSQVAVTTMQPDNSYGSSIWQSGVGPAADSSGNLFLSTANGVFNFTANDLGDSVLKMSVGPKGFSLEDSFTPFDQANMASNDLDLGSAGPILLPTQTGSTTPDLLVASGKDADIYLINRDNMGGYNPSGNTQIVQYLPTALLGELFGSPLYWNNFVYLLAHQDYLRSYSLSTDGSGVTSLSTNPVAKTVGKLTTFGLPVISANGNTNGIVWLVRSVSGVPKLSAYDAITLFLLYDSGQAAGGRDTLGTIGHFATPIVANGKVFAGTQTQLVTYGLFPAIVPTTGNGQTGNAGTTLPVSLTITANNPYTGLPISGVPVTFSDGGKGGIFSNPSGTTDSNGQVSTTYTLPKTPQTVTITVTSSGYAPATFTETGVLGPLATITTVSGGKQSGTVGTTLPSPIVVKAKDAVGNAIPNVSITFSDGLGGTFSPNPGITGSNGQASVTYTLPTVAKTITVTASNGSITDKITESALPGPATSINIVQGNNQTAHVHNLLPKSLIVSVTDQYLNGIAGLTVTFTDNGAGGTFSNTMPVTNSAGKVTVTYTTPSVPGTVTITASYSTLTPATFTETVIP